MVVLLNLRRWLRSHPVFAVIFGGLVLLSSALAAVIFRFAYFYSTFVIGMFLFFDALAHLIDNSLSFTSNLEHIGRTFWTVLLAFIILTDLVGGQMIFKVWEYPPYHNIFNWLLLYLIIYPVGGLSLIAMYRFFELFLGKVFGNKISSENASKKILKVIFYLLPLAVIIPAGLYFSGYVPIIVKNWSAYFLLFLFLFFEWTFFLDTLILACGGKTVLGDILSGNKKVILAIIISALLGAFSHELINTFVHEWVYLPEKFPVTTATFLNVPVMVFITWAPLTVVTVSAYRLAMILKEKEFFQAIWREYFN